MIGDAAGETIQNKTAESEGTPRRFLRLRPLNSAQASDSTHSGHLKANFSSGPCNELSEVVRVAIYFRLSIPPAELLPLRAANAHFLFTSTSFDTATVMSLPTEGARTLTHTTAPPRRNEGISGRRCGNPLRLSSAGNHLHAIFQRKGRSVITCHNTTEHQSASSWRSLE